MAVTVLARESSAAFTGFMGRVCEVTLALQLLHEARIVTVVGPGGVGKTRLMQQVADLIDKHASEAPHYRDGVVTVDLSSVRSDSRLYRAIGDELGVSDLDDQRGEQSLIEHCRTKEMLVIFDHCEHLPAISSLVQNLCMNAPGIQILATSRIQLSVRGEKPLWLDPLPVPQARELLLDRAASVSNRWRDVQRGAAVLTENESTAANRLCVKLDGLPLAIELAAMHLDAVAIGDLADKQAKALDMLEGTEYEHEHHQSLRATFDVSYELLDADARGTWGALSVFVGSFDLTGAQAVCEAVGIERATVRTLLRDLVRHSLLSVSTSQQGRTRYRMMETIREYGDELVPDAMRDPLRRAHADYIFDVVEQATADWLSSREVQWYEHLQAEEPNIFVALAFYATSPGLELHGVILAANCVRTKFQLYHGHLDTVTLMIEQALAGCPGVPTVHHVDALSLGAWVGMIQARPSARTMLREAERITAELGIPELPSLLVAKGIEMWLYETRRQVAAAGMDYFARAETSYREAGSQFTPDAHLALLCHATLAAFVADRDRARALAKRVSKEASDHDALWSTAWGHFNVALAELGPGGNSAWAVESVQRALRVQRDLGDLWGPVWSLWLLACLLVDVGDVERAAKLMGGAAVQAETIELSHGELPVFSAVRDRVMRQALAAIGERNFGAALAAGRAKGYRAILDLALTPVAPDLAARSTLSTPSAEIAAPSPPPVLMGAGLTPRESQLCVLLVEGRSNGEIASILGVAVGTVQNRLDDISSKLGVRGRLLIADHARRLLQPAHPENGGTADFTGMPDTASRGRAVLR